MIEGQRARLAGLASRILPGVTVEELFQPHDHPALAAQPEFNFEGRTLSGYLAVGTALRAEKEIRNPTSETSDEPAGLEMIETGGVRPEIRFARQDPRLDPDFAFSVSGPST